MTNLSPTTQAVLATYEKVWGQGYGSPLAAALRAVADQVVPEEQNSDFVPGAPRAYEIQRRVTRHQLLAIAAELENN